MNLPGSIEIERRGAFDENKAQNILVKPYRSPHWSAQQWYMIQWEEGKCLMAADFLNLNFHLYLFNFLFFFSALYLLTSSFVTLFVCMNTLLGCSFYKAAFRKYLWYFEFKLTLDCSCPWRVRNFPGRFSPFDVYWSINHHGNSLEVAYISSHLLEWRD